MFDWNLQTNKLLCKVCITIYLFEWYLTYVTEASNMAGGNWAVPRGNTHPSAGCWLPTYSRRGNQQELDLPSERPHGWDWKAPALFVCTSALLFHRFKSANWKVIWKYFLNVIKPNSPFRHQNFLWDLNVSIATTTATFLSPCRGFTRLTVIIHVTIYDSITQMSNVFSNSFMTIISKTTWAKTWMRVETTLNTDNRR